ncbi:hypothetical protein VNO77_03476 [Canavalia gladiata]|uniref:Uncharacterized protein n=1 Tax=Canavalia gladiata TaxID=3824 RepID=A0AAN9MZX7_CANGL
MAMHIALEPGPIHGLPSMKRMRTFCIASNITGDGKLELQPRASARRIRIHSALKANCDRSWGSARQYFSSESISLLHNQHTKYVPVFTLQGHVMNPNPWAMRYNVWPKERQRWHGLPFDEK